MASNYTNKMKWKMIEGADSRRTISIFICDCQGLTEPTNRMRG